MRADFDRFALAEGPALRRFAVHLLGSATYADDVVQETLFKVSLRWSRLDGPLAYARLTLLNVVRDGARARRRRPETIGLHAVPERANGRDVAGDVAVRDELLRALASLPLQMRAVVVLRYVEDRSEAETAADLGISRGSVKSQGSRGLERMRAQLADNDRGEGARL